MNCSRSLDENELVVFHISRFRCEAQRGIREIRVQVYLAELSTPVRVFHLTGDTPLQAIKERAALYAELELELMRTIVARYRDKHTD